MSRGLRAGRALRLLELLLVVGAALFALGFHLTLPSRLAGEDDWRALTASLEQRAEPGDAVVLHPWWTDEARRFLPASLALHGDPHAAGRDWVESPRLWVISQPALPRADTRTFEAAFLPGREPLGETAHFGTLELRAYKNLRHRPVLFDAVASLARAQAWIETPGAARRPCRRSGEGFTCPGLGALRAGFHEVDFAPVQCLPLPAPGGASRLVLEFRNVPRTGNLLLEAGIIGEEAWKTSPGLTPVTLGLAADGVTSQTLELPAGLEGLQTLELEGTRGGTHTLQLSASAQSPGRRVPCVSLRALGPTAEGAR